MLALCTPDFDLMQQNTLLTLLQGLLCPWKTIKKYPFMTLQLEFQSVMSEYGAVLPIKAQRACTLRLKSFLLWVYITPIQQADRGAKCRARTRDLKPRLPTWPMTLTSAAITMEQFLPYKGSSVRQSHQLHVPARGIQT